MYVHYYLRSDRTVRQASAELYRYQLSRGRQARLECKFRYKFLFVFSIKGQFSQSSARDQGWTICYCSRESARCPKKSGICFYVYGAPRGETIKIARDIRRINKTRRSKQKPQCVPYPPNHLLRLSLSLSRAHPLLPLVYPQRTTKPSRLRSSIPIPITASPSGDSSSSSPRRSCTRWW